jgi:hypothetical protein
LKAAVRIAEIDDRILESLRRFHDSNVRRFALCVKYIIAQKRGKIGGLMLLIR